VHGTDCARVHRNGEQCCPDDECPACNGEQCWLCGAGVGSYSPAVPCEHDVIDRHTGGRYRRAFTEGLCWGVGLTVGALLAWYVLVVWWWAG
jgi:hypothetical protein